MFRKDDRVRITHSDYDHGNVFYTGMTGTVTRDQTTSQVHIMPDKPRPMPSGAREQGFFHPARLVEKINDESVVTVTIDVEVDLANISTADLLAEVARRVK